MTDFKTSISVKATPQAAFDAINRPRDWWGKAIEGPTDILDGEWTYRYKDLHWSRHVTTELVAGKRVVWRVVDSRLTFLKDQTEWKGADIVFDIAPNSGKTEIRLTHVGLTPAVECYAMCEPAWTGLIQDSLKALIETGKGIPDAL